MNKKYATPEEMAALYAEAREIDAIVMDVFSDEERSQIERETPRASDAEIAAALAATPAAMSIPTEPYSEWLEKYASGPWKVCERYRQVLLDIDRRENNWDRELREFVERQRRKAS